jgi:hypothetical protein
VRKLILQDDNGLSGEHDLEKQLGPLIEPRPADLDRPRS